MFKFWQFEHVEGREFKCMLPMRLRRAFSSTCADSRVWHHPPSSKLPPALFSLTSDLWLLRPGHNAARLHTHVATDFDDLQGFGYKGGGAKEDCARCERSDTLFNPAGQPIAAAASFRWVRASQVGRSLWTLVRVRFCWLLAQSASRAN